MSTRPARFLGEVIQHLCAPARNITPGTDQMLKCRKTITKHDSNRFELAI